MGSEREWGDQGPGCCSPPGDDGGQDQGQEKWDYSEIFEARVHRMQVECAMSIHASVL